MKKIVMGILAHVDAGKTTLSESMLFLSGKIREMGRVDTKNAYLDTYALEKERGITIYAKEAILTYGQTEINLIDTPGHVDFSAEMERTLSVLDYAILVVSGADGIQGHTKTLWRLLEIYDIPVFIFVNKMDQAGTDPKALLSDLKSNLSDRIIDMTGQVNAQMDEELALSDETLMETYLQSSRIDTDRLKKVIQKRKVFPLYFGSALKMQGVDALVEGLDRWVLQAEYPQDFGAKVYKITRDEQGNRQTHLKITGGKLSVKDSIKIDGNEEKVNQIRLYSGKKYENVQSVEAGRVCVVTGLSASQVGQGYGYESHAIAPLLEPVLIYTVILPDGIDEKQMMPKLLILEEEAPDLKFVWDEQLREIKVGLMGRVQLEVLQSLVKDRFDIAIQFGEGKIVYKETIDNEVEGVGHFEPLRHYAEVHVVLRPMPRGHGVSYKLECSEDILDKNWQRLVLTHFKEKSHKGVLVGAPITDIELVLVTGRAHNKHTEGGDFREATYRAIRHGLMKANAVLLEPYYDFELEVDTTLVGRAMTDIDKMNGTCELRENTNGQALIVGRGPVSTLQNYHQEVIAYSKGEGRLLLTPSGYDRCHNAEEVIETLAYDPERDLLNPPGSVFCARGAGFPVAWNEVESHMHLESVLKPKAPVVADKTEPIKRKATSEWLSLEEIDAILGSVSRANSGKKGQWQKKHHARDHYYESLNSPSKVVKGDPYLLVDGYNIIFTWESLRALAEDNMDGARTKLLDILSNYQGMKGMTIIVVFDAYRVKGRKVSTYEHHNIHVVYTGEAQTADTYIEQFTHENSRKYDITVATSDGMQQMIIRGAGSKLVSARELEDLVIEEAMSLRQSLVEASPQTDNPLISEKDAKILNKILNKGNNHM